MRRPTKLVLAGLTAALVATAGFLTGSMLIAAGMAPVAQGKGAGCGPGPIKCNNDQTDAFAIWEAPDFTFVTFSATRSSFVIRPRGLPPTVTPVQTEVFVNFSTPTINGFSCFVVPDSALVVSRDLQSASLNVTLTQDMTCPGFTTPILQDIGVIPLAGGGPPPGFGLPLPMDVSITWVGPGLPFSFTNTGTQRCGSFTSTFQMHGLNSGATANGTVVVPNPDPAIPPITMNLGSTTQAGVDQLSVQTISNGVPPSACLVAG